MSDERIDIETVESPAWEEREKAFRAAQTADAVVSAQREYLEAEIRNAVNEETRILQTTESRLEPIRDSIRSMRAQLELTAPSEDDDDPDPAPPEEVEIPW